MTETKRVPTEGEVNLLLRDTRRKMEDDAAIAAQASEIGRFIPMRKSMLVWGVIFFAGVVFLPFLDRSVPQIVWTVLAAARAARSPSPRPPPLRPHSRGPGVPCARI